jgi:hypothetical protein
MRKICIVTGGYGSVGSEVITFFSNCGYSVVEIKSTDETEQVFKDHSGCSINCVVHCDTAIDTLNLLELTKRYATEDVSFILYSHNDYNEEDLVVHYGVTNNINTVVFRDTISDVAILIKCIMRDEPYEYKSGKISNVMHVHDLVSAFWQYHQHPSIGEVYSIKGQSISFLEAVDTTCKILGSSWNNYIIESTSEVNMMNNNFKRDYPEWNIKYKIDTIIHDIICSEANSVITSELCGGIGNQLFQVALAYAYSRKFNRSLKFIKNQFSGCRQGSHPNNYYNNIFQKLEFVDELKTDNIISEKSWSAYDMTEEIKSMTGNICFKGYFQSQFHFKDYIDEIRNLFTPDGGIVAYLKRNTDLFISFPELLDDDEDRVFLGVRRGDYITYAHCHNPCGMDYYNKAMSRFPENTKYYIMSDEFSWCKEHFKGDNFKFIDFKFDLHVLLTISLFKKFIISNSSFYWWGSFLSSNSSRVIAPDKWLNESGYFTIYRPEMEVIERLVEIN